MTFVAGAKQRILLTLGALGRGLQQVASGNVEAKLGADTTNQIAFDGTGAITLTTATIIAAALPAVNAAEVGATLAVTPAGR